MKDEDTAVLTEEHRKEALSKAYIQAIAGKCGMSCSKSDFDYGIDITINEVQQRKGRYVESGFKLDIQAKSTITATVKDDHVVYDLEVKNYDDLRQDQLACPRILVLLVLPHAEPEWVTHTEEELTVRYCAYWMSLKGANPTDNSSKIRIRIPRDNAFSMDGLDGLMQRVKEGDEL